MPCTTLLSSGAPQFEGWLGLEGGSPDEIQYKSSTKILVLTSPNCHLDQHTLQHHPSACHAPHEDSGTAPASCRVLPWCPH